jgi:hypothetical protein
LAKSATTRGQVVRDVRRQKAQIRQVDDVDVSDEAGCEPTAIA